MHTCREQTLETPKRETGFPVGWIIAEKIRITINISGLFFVRLSTSIIFLLSKNKITKGNWKDIPNNNDNLVMNWK